MPARMPRQPLVQKWKADVRGHFVPQDDGSAQTPFGFHETVFTSSRGDARAEPISEFP